MVNVAGVLLLALVQAAQSWSVGTQREVDQGVYMQLVASQHGWRIWKTETRSGITCKAVKSAVGRPHPRPVGVQNWMTGGTPYLEMEWGSYGGRFSYSWKARHYEKVDVQYRAIGARFWDQVRGFDWDAAVVGEQRIELVVSSWEYGAILVGRVEERGEFDMAGLSWAQQQVRDCQGLGEDTAGTGEMIAPIWAIMPSPSWPTAAFEHRTEARVDVDCVIQSDGTLRECEIKEETPAGFGFGASAVQSMARARLTPANVHRVGAGNRYTFTQRFRVAQ